MDDPKDLLDDLCWTADRVVTNPFGERVWLKQHDGGGVTDCCDEAAPCEYHSRLTHPAPPHQS